MENRVHFSYAYEHILNALVVDGRRLGSARRFIVAHDEIPTYGVYASHIPELTVTVRLREKLVFYGYEAGRIAFGAVPEHENCRDAFHRLCQPEPRAARHGHTMSRLPDWLHPWRWYAATVIVEALHRHLLLGETARAIGGRFGRHASEWRSLRRWRAELLVSPTLWGWLRSRLGVSRPAETQRQGRLHLSRFLGEMRIAWESAARVLDELAAAVRASLSGLVHNRKQAWPATQFRPEVALHQSRRDIFGDGGPIRQVQNSSDGT